MGLVQAKIETAVETSPQLIESLHMAREVALKSNVAEVLPVHLILAMLEDDESSFLLEAYGVDFNKVRSQLSKIVQSQVRPKTADRHAVFSPGIELIMQHARQQAQKNALGEVDSNLVLAVILSERGGYLEKMLQPHDLDMSGVLQYLELREGKTVHMDPLPSTQTPLPSTRTPLPSTRTKAPRPASNPPRRPVPTAPARAPAPLAPAPLAQGETPFPGTPARPANTPQNPAPAPAPLAAPPLPMPAPMQNAPQATNPPARQNSPSPRDDLAAGLRQALASPGTPPAARAPAAVAQNNRPLDASSGSPTPEPSQHTVDAPPTSRFRAMFGKLSRVMPAKGRQKDADRKTDQAPQEISGTGAGVPRGTPQGANQSKPAAFAPDAPDASLAATAANSNHYEEQATRSVDGLVNRPDEALSQADAAAHTDARLNLHANRRTRRRRAIPATPGSNQSLSATGSVLEKGRLVENVPRRMKVNNSSKAEVRITRAQMDEINSEFDDLSLSHIHDLAVTEAMTVQLRAPGSGFHIENLSPQTQWIDRNQRHINDADFGVWRWNVTPTKSGKARLQLVISARTVDDEGTIHIADIPDKIIELSIYRDHARIAKRVGLIALVAISGLALGRFGETALQLIAKMAAQLG